MSINLTEAVDAYRGGPWKVASRRPDGGLNGECPLCGGTDRFWIGTLSSSGKVSIQCNQGCKFGRLIDALNIDRKPVPWPDPKAVYVYHDSAGRPVVEVCRYDPRTEFPPTNKKPHGEVLTEKSFRQRQPGTGEWRRPSRAAGLVYHLPAVRAGVKARERIVVVEGEKDADRLVGMGFTATCNIGGAAKSTQRAKWGAKHAEWLQGAATVVVVPDADEAGIAHAEAVAQSLVNGVERVFVVDSSNQLGHALGSKRDISDWLDADRTRDRSALESVFDGAPRFTEPSAGAAESSDPALRRFESNPSGLVAALLSDVPERLLVIRSRQGNASTLRVLNAWGLWESPDAFVSEWLAKFCRLRAGAAIEYPPKEGAQALRDYRVADRSGYLPVLEAIDAGMALLKGQSALTTCFADQLDQDCRYLGATNGVVDLHEGRLLDPTEGRSHLVTASTQVPFRPWPSGHPKNLREDVDRLFEHLDRETQQFWWKALAFAMLGAVDRRLYAAIGPRKGGKTSVYNGLQAALGPYCSVMKDSLLHAGKRESTGGADPERRAILAPVRMALMEEVISGNLDKARLKRWSGGGTDTYRDLYARETLTKNVTATMVLFMNDDQVPRFGLTDDALGDRYQEIPYPAVPEELQIADYRERMRDDTALAAALFARLVHECSHLESKMSAPKSPSVVRSASEARAKREAGSLGEFARRLVRGDDLEKLPVRRVWRAWCTFVGAEEDARVAGNIQRNSFPARLKDCVPALGHPTKLRFEHEPQPVWVGWALREEAEVLKEEQDQDVIDAICVALRPVALRALYDRRKNDLLAADVHTVLHQARLRGALKFTPAAPIGEEVSTEVSMLMRSRGFVSLNAGRDAPQEPLGATWRVLYGWLTAAREESRLIDVIEDVLRPSPPHGVVSEALPFEGTTPCPNCGLIVRDDLENCPACAAGPPAEPSPGAVVLPSMTYHRRIRALERAAESATEAASWAPASASPAE